MMKKLLLPFFLFIVQYCFSQASFQLAPPMLKYKSGFFSGATSFEVVFNQPGAEVHYTLNDTEPTESDPVYSKAVPITKRTIVKVKAFSKDFLPSETVSTEFIKDGKAIDSINFSKPNEYYAHGKADILHDNVGGIANYRSGGWLGYDNDTVTIYVYLKKKETINSILISLLQDENSWIFMPQQILTSYYDDKKKAYLPAGKEVFFNEGPGPKEVNAREIIPRRTISTRKLLIEIFPLKKIPDWHNGKGNHGWLFIDEIKVY